MSVRAALAAVRPGNRETRLVVLARLIVDGEAHRLSRIHDLALLIADGQSTARAEQALGELDAVLMAMRAPQDRLQEANEADVP